MLGQFWFFSFSWMNDRIICFSKGGKLIFYKGFMFNVQIKSWGPFPRRTIIKICTRSYQKVPFKGSACAHILKWNFKQQMFCKNANWNHDIRRNLFFDFFYPELDVIFTKFDLTNNNFKVKGFHIFIHSLADS